MPQRLRLVQSTTAAVLAAALAGSCGLVPGETFGDGATVDAEITSVRLESGPGDVTLRGREDLDRVTLERTVEYRGDRPEGATHRVEDGVLVLGGCGRRCEVRYTVDVPAGITVTGSTSNGRVTLDKVGAVDVSTSNGRVELEDVAGPVEVRTNNGRITGRGLRGDGIRAETSNGEVDLALAAPQDVRVRTSNGDVVLTVPGARYRVTADSDNGDRNIGVDDDPSGPYTLDLATGNGGITVKRG
ncbi:hypothetical protein GCM10010420_05140 [Streptomyces glaucosporus]|uniref:DUF4097 domain-containing protein n=1 Tax=Streptomyces glaucosporus TaxID=284044 RepID=A0ABN3HRI0_9ACTN